MSEILTDFDPVGEGDTDPFDTEEDGLVNETGEEERAYETGEDYLTEPGGPWDTGE